MIKPRRLEPFFETSPYIAEFWNTISNLPFMIIAILRLMGFNYPKITQAYSYLFFIGLGSAVHHATPQTWTIIFDYIPIVGFIYFILTTFDIFLLSSSIFFEIFLSFLILYLDHSTDLIPVPWGHFCWHLLISISLDNMLQNFKYINCMQD